MQHDRFLLQKSSMIHFWTNYRMASLNMIDATAGSTCANSSTRKHTTVRHDSCIGIVSCLTALAQPQQGLCVCETYIGKPFGTRVSVTTQAASIQAKLGANDGFVSSAYPLALADKSLVLDGFWQGAYGLS
jgi:hypothetical protein